MSKQQRPRAAGSAVFGIAAAALLASTASPAMAAEPTSIELPATKVSVQVANEALAADEKPASKLSAKIAMSVSDQVPPLDPIEPELNPDPVDPVPVDPTPTDPPVDPGPVDPTPTDPPVDPGPVDPTPTDPPVDPTDPPVGPTTPPVGPTIPPVTINPNPGTTTPVVPVAPNKPNPGGVKQPESIKNETTALQPNGVTKSGTIKTPVKHAQRVAVKTPSGTTTLAVIPAGATSVTPYIPDNAVLVDTGLGAQSTADKDIEFWSIIAGTTLLAGAGAGLVVARRGRRAKA